MSAADEKDPTTGGAGPEGDATEPKAAGKKKAPARKAPAKADGTAAEGGGRGSRRSTGKKTPAKAEAAEAEEKPKKRAPARAKAAKADVEAAEAEEKPKRKAPAKATADGEAETPADAEEPVAEAAEDAPPIEEPEETAEPAAAPAQRSRRPAGEPVAVSARARYVRTSARKARLVCDTIRGKDVEEARAVLDFTTRAAATPWKKLLESAVANAEHNHELVGEELAIVAIAADEGPTLKRYRPRAMGRATPIKKRTSHLSITLAPKE